MFVESICAAVLLITTICSFEIKYGQTVSRRELRALRDFVDERNCRYGIVINNDSRICLYEKNIIGIPFGAL